MRKYLDIINEASPPVNEEMEIDQDEIETPEEQARYEHMRKIEKAVLAYCQQEIGWDMGDNYPVHYDMDDNELYIDPNEDLVTLEQLMKLRVFGEVQLSASSKQWSLRIIIKTPPGLNIS